ncbi:MAG TPA: TetR/AcrR family transcriptional regulator [Solirubrobacterales bacterium]|jgi:AcrR family transcriptional regulator|nr:TetR/AcrR family transcriptional regulator [Solirubrobacterales bacterium]
MSDELSDKKRPYKMKRRAELEAQTKQRITESAVELHGTLGPARTSMKAVAEHAGVPRSTVYRHFADEEELFGACSAHWAAENPPPDVTQWQKIGDPSERLESALAELYAYYRRAGGMLGKLFRDEAQVPIVAKLFAPYHQLMAMIVEILMRGRGLRGKARDRTRAAIAHAISFHTWQQLTEEGELGDEEAAELMRRLVAAAA